jgi:predicted nucleic acid-binding protein
MEQTLVFIDSWIWLEFFLEGKKFKAVEAILENIRNGKLKGILNPLVLAEVKYQIERKYREIAEEAIFQIEKFPNSQVMPIDPEIAKFGANLRAKYYKKPERMVSYADMINVATALLSNCKKFYTGDKNLKDIKEIEVVCNLNILISKNFKNSP